MIRISIRKVNLMAKHRLYSLLYYGAAALVGAVLMSMMAVTAILAVAMPFAAAAAVDRYVNREAEPDERLRSFMIYLVGGVAGLLLILMFGSRLGSLTFVAPLLGFIVAALVDYVMPPAGYQPRDPHRYGASPPVTLH
jgi:hypothetical protein